MANTFELIASYTVGAGGTSSINFTSIPSTYTDLMLVFSGRMDNNPFSIAWTDSLLTFNGSSASFTDKLLYGDGSVATSQSATATVVRIPSSGATALTFGNVQIYIPNYAGSTNKSFSMDYVTENNATQSRTEFHAGLWTNTAAINQITLTAQASGNFSQYSTAYLYGVNKNA
jgi:hypothetical protein